MCGLVGFIDLKRRAAKAELARRAETMAQTLIHRGPDDAGVWVDEESGLALGFRRLSIVDLSPAGHQPMISASGRNVIVYNGEIYNAAQLRPELEAKGIVFRGHSDTEVILEACEAWGVSAAVKRFVGMFAFAVWDRRERRLYLVRDRLGIKPLYYGRLGQTFFFGSQPKSFFPHPDWHARLDVGALAEYLRFNYVPNRLSIYQGLRQVAPGAMVTVDVDDIAPENGAYRLKYIQDKLRKDCDEYITYLNRFDGIRAGYLRYNYIGEISFDFVLEIHLDRIHNGNLINAPFIMGIRINEEGTFYLMYAAKYDWSAQIKSMMKNDREPKGLHAFLIDEISDPERFEKEFMFQVFNQRLTGYVDSFNKNKGLQDN